MGNGCLKKKDTTPQVVTYDAEMIKLVESYLEYIIEKANICFGTETGAIYEKRINDNKPQIIEHFQKREWSESDFKQREWTKMPTYETYYLGEKKNSKGMTINCNGVELKGNLGRIEIGTFREESNIEYSQIWIDET